MIYFCRRAHKHRSQDGATNCGWCKNIENKLPDFYDVLGILSDNPPSQEEIKKMQKETQGKPIFNPPI